MASTKTIGRLSLYRRLLKEVVAGGEQYIFSHDLARLAGCTPAQVRRDVMTVGYSGSPARGYDAEELIAAIIRFLDLPASTGAALVGVGNLGRALMTYFVGRGSQFAIVAAFDSDPAKVNRVVHGCRCYPVTELEQVVAEQGIHLGLLAVPGEQAQETAGMLYRAGIRGVLNFAPVRLWAPENVYVENVDVTMSLERVAYFARPGSNATHTGDNQ